MGGGIPGHHRHAAVWSVSQRVHDLEAALDAGRPLVVVAYLALLALIFIGMAYIVMNMAKARVNAQQSRVNRREEWLSVLPPAALAVLVLVMGLYIPPELSGLLHDVARAMGGN